MEETKGVSVTWGKKLVEQNVLSQVGELRKRVAEVGLDTKGTKAELIARVEKYLSEQGSAWAFAVVYN